MTQERGRAALDQYEAVTGVRFIEGDDPALADIQFLGNYSTSGYSWAY